MIVKMKLYEKWCGDYVAKFKRNWEFTCIAKDAYLEGYRKGREESYKVCGQEGLDSILAAGSEEVEVELKDGEHQLK